MIKEWTTVASWQQGIAVLNCEQRSGCGSCGAKNSCGTAVLSKLGPQIHHQLHVSIEQPLEPGQKVEIGIAEKSLISSALLVYMTPLLGLMAGGAIGQFGLASDAGAAISGVIGALLGFICARWGAKKLSACGDYHPVVLQVGLPPSMIHTPANN